MLPTSTSPNEAIQKHRACDECRIRKLACTKEPDGCSRCRRENIPCHYSPQKPMGRPRKRPRDESDERSIEVEPPPKTTMTEPPPDTEDPGMEFINLLLGSNFEFDIAAHTQPAPAPTPVPVAAAATTTMETETPSSIRDQPWSYTHFGEVDFGSQPTGPPTSFSTPNIDPSLFGNTTGLDPPPMDQVPALSPPNTNTTGSPQSSSTSPAGTTPTSTGCDCTANLYSALDSMQKIPSEVESAIRQARLAAKTAYEVVNCRHCSFSFDLPSPHATGSSEMMRSFQNMMLLGTLIPSIVHAYARMLTVVDDETNRAVAERRKVVFKLNGLGGIWGRFGEADDQLCGAQRNFGYREMEPVMWRLTVRALLKIDVYGISGCRANDVTVADPFHLGLKDIVLLMETKSKARHAFMDAMVSAGIWQQPNCVFSTHKPGETPTCQRIISIARSAVEQLCIA